MTGRRTLAVFALGIAVGIAAATLVAEFPQALHNAAGVSDAEPARTAATGEEPAQSKRDKGSEPGERQPVSIKLAADDIAAAGIELAPVEHGTLARWIIVPGTIVPGTDRIARVSVRLSATVAELRKKLGDAVAKDEVLAVLESREVAEAKSEYLAARLTADLQKELYDRDKALFDRHVASEQQVLRSRSAVAQAGVKLDIARQKLFALGLTEKEIAAIPAEPQVNLRRQEVLAPMAGHVVDRKVDLGSAVGRDNLETELFTIADLERVWVELAVSPTDLPLVKEGQTVTVAAHGLTNRAVGKLVFISPMLDRDTHTARVVAEIPNPDGNWRPGSLVRCAVAIAERVAPLTVPTSAVQTIGQVPVVFVRTAEGFEKRTVTLGETDDRSSEIRSGVRAGETVAVRNTFALKAEFTKALAED
jgi:cobalt-zinc-cadmium efflux system membrane fusion protein